LALPKLQISAPPVLDDRADTETTVAAVAPESGVVAHVSKRKDANATEGQPPVHVVENVGCKLGVA
jgi:hypothetical protein